MSNGSVQNTETPVRMEEQAPQMTPSGDTISGAQKGKKRQREEKTDDQGSPSKRAKQATGEKVVKVLVKRSIRGNTRTRPPLQETQEIEDVTEAPVKRPKWMIPTPVEINASRSSFTLNAGKGSEVKTSRPRIWTGLQKSREELLGMLPDGLNSKFVNGFSWLLYENPVLLLDDTTPFNEVIRDNMDHRVIDLITTRSFMCDDPRTLDAKVKETTPSVPTPTGNHGVDKAPPTVAVKSRPGRKPKNKLIDPPTSALAPLEQGESTIGLSNHQVIQETAVLGDPNERNGNATLPIPLESRLNNVESIALTYPHPPQESYCQGAISQDDKVYGPRVSSSGVDSVVTSLQTLPFRKLTAPPDNPLSIPIQPVFRVLKSGNYHPDQLLKTALSTLTPRQLGASFPSVTPGPLPPGSQGGKTPQIIHSHDETLPRKSERGMNTSASTSLSNATTSSSHPPLVANPSISVDHPESISTFHTQGKPWGTALKDNSLSSGKAMTVLHPHLELYPLPALNLPPSSNPFDSISTTQRTTRSKALKTAPPNSAEEKGLSLRAAPQPSSSKPIVPIEALSSGVPNGGLHTQPSTRNTLGKARNKCLKDDIVDSGQTDSAKKGTNAESQASSSTSRPMLPVEGSLLEQCPRDMKFQDVDRESKDEGGFSLQNQGKQKLKKKPRDYENAAELPAKQRRPPRESGEYWDKPCKRCARAGRKCEKEGGHMNRGSCYHCYKARCGCDYSREQHKKKKVVRVRIAISEDKGDTEDVECSLQPKARARLVDEDRDTQPSTTNLVEPGSQVAENPSTPREPIDLDSYLPSTIPDELHAIVNAYMCGNPITIWASNKHLSESWALPLAKEFGYVMMGFFRVVGIQEMRCPLTQGPMTQLMKNGMVYGRVKWRFRLRWAPGGEEFILTKENQAHLEYSWWKPPPWPSPKSEAPEQEQSPSSNTRIEGSQSKPRMELKIGDTMGEEPEDDFATIPKYRSARLAHSNYKFRHSHYDDRFTSLVLLHLLAPFGTITPDDSFPRGWFCVECGRLNYQVALRHRGCPSSFCKDSLIVHKPYRVELEFMRDPKDALPVPTPLSTYPPDLTPMTTNWNDEGTQTISCFLQKDESVFIKHVFVRNYPPLQLEATRLLAKIQLNVAVSRVVGVHSPYFYYDASSSAEDKDPTNENWKDLPECMNHAKHWIVHQARHFGELKSTQLSINHLSILGWVSAGSRKAPDLIRAKDKSVIFWVLGCNVVLTVRPCSRRGIAAKKEEIELDSLIPIEDVNEDEPEPNSGSGWVGALQTEEDQGSSPEDNPPVAAVERKLQKATSKKDNIVLSLVHGDVVVFYGDDFQYSIKRDGTSLLVIGSHNDEV